jgi:hypothetical protein
MDFMNTTIPSESANLTGLESQSQRRLTEGRAAGEGEGEGALATLVEAALGAGMEQLRELKAWRGQVTDTLDAMGRAASANADGLRSVTQSLARVEAALGSHTDAVEAQKAGFARVEVQLTHLAKVNNVNAHNLEQVRLQTEMLARNAEKLSQEVILRQVMDPFFVALARFYEAVYALSGRSDVSDADLQSIQQRIRGFLEDHNVELIHPDDGEPLDPRRHQPVKHRCAPDSDSHGRIASTFNVGLVHGQRVVQAARVEVFIFADAPSENSAQKSTTSNPL